MATTQQMAEFLLLQDPPKYPARLAFYNYLKNCWPTTTDLSTEIIQDFWLRALSLQSFERSDDRVLAQKDSSAFEPINIDRDHWRNYRQQLTDRILEDLNHFFHSRDEVGFKMSLSPSHLQVLNIEYPKDFKIIVESDLELQKEKGDQIRYLDLNNGVLLALWLKHKGGLRVLGYRPQAYVDGSSLRPLPPTTDLRYDFNFELSKFERQLLEASAFTSFYFQIEDHQISGVSCQQNNFQKRESFEVNQLTQQLNLFYSLKRLEQNYIRPDSDPFYQELIGLLEKSYQLISQGEAGAQRLAEAALSKGRMAHQNIFPEDRYLLSLITNIEYWLVKIEQKANKERHAPTQEEKATFI